MAKSGQPDFFAGSEEGMNSPLDLNSPYLDTDSDPVLSMPLPSVSGSELIEVGTIMGKQFNSQQYGQPAGTSSGVVHDQHLTNINVSRTGTPGMAPDCESEEKRS
ncbi:hypothetical protein SLA2020_379600 [Shorea laevis]